MGKIYIHVSFCDTKDEIVEKQKEVKNIKDKMWLTGKSKDYLNCKRRISCNKSGCLMCNMHPTNKASKKTKGMKKINDHVIKDIINEIYD